jgi:hypothetical protein
VRRLSDARQQEMAEWLGSWTVVLIGGYIELNQREDHAGAVTWRDNATKRLDSVDMFDQDLTDVRLTSKGVVAR